MTKVTPDDLISSLIERRGTVVILGGIDTGKTSFGLTLAKAAHVAGIHLAYVDGDIGQSSIGPPTCVGLKFLKDLDEVTPESVARADELGFVGSTSPDGHLLPLVSGTARLVAFARQAGCEMVIVDTSSFISGTYAEILKYYKLDLIRPDAVVGFQRGEELDPIIGVVSRFFSSEVVTLKVSRTIEERSAEERLAAREASFAAYFAPPLSRWRVKPSVFMPAIPPGVPLSRLHGLVVGLEDGKGRCSGIGILEYEQDGNVLRMLSAAAEPAKGLRLGSVRMTPQGRQTGLASIRELFG